MCVSVRVCVNQIIHGMSISVHQRAQIFSEFGLDEMKLNLEPTSESTRSMIYKKHLKIQTSLVAKFF